MMCWLHWEERIRLMDLSNHIQEEIFKAIQSLRYGSVEVVVHDSQVVQIERKEKVRFAGQPAATSSSARY
jgi:hypothetical protein